MCFFFCSSCGLQPVEGVVQHEDEEVPIKLWDCDSITQAKEKILDVLYRNTPVSKRPQLREIDLGILLCSLVLSTSCFFFFRITECTQYRACTSNQQLVMIDQAWHTHRGGWGQSSEFMSVVHYIL